MASTVYTLSNIWSTAAKYTAAAEVDILISNPNGNTVVTWTITASDTLPTVEESAGHPLLPHTSRAMTLASGERLWTTGPTGTFSTLEE